MQELWRSLAAERRPILLYGMGDGADKVLAACVQKGVEISGVFASDGFVREKRFHGFSLLSLAQAEALFGDFTVLLCFGTRLPDVMETILALRRRHALFIPDVPVAGSALFDQAFASAHAAQLEEAYSLFADELSRALFRSLVFYKLTGRPEYLLEHTSAFSDDVRALIAPRADDVLLDIGAYTGDTIALFSALAGGLRFISAFEPDVKSAAKLRQLLQRTAPGRHEVFEAAAWNARDALLFSSGAGRGSVLGNGKNVPALAPDETVCMPPSIIKIDAEGAEGQALRGCRKLLQHRPRLCCAAYHRSEDLFTLPQLIRSLRPESRLYLRRAPCFPAWEVNLFAL